MPVFLTSILWRLGQATISFFIYKALRSTYNEVARPYGSENFTLHCEACRNTFQSGRPRHECYVCGTCDEIRFATSKERFHLLLTKQFTRQ